MPYSDRQTVQIKATAMRVAFAGYIVGGPQLKGGRTFYSIQDGKQTHLVPEDAIEATAGKQKIVTPGVPKPVFKVDETVVRTVSGDTVHDTSGEPMKNVAPRPIAHATSVAPVEQTPIKSSSAPAKSIGATITPDGKRMAQFNCAGCGQETTLYKQGGSLQGRPPTKCTTCKENANWSEKA